MELLYLYLPAIILLGIITCIEDHKFGKIRNKLIVAALAYSIVMMGIFLLATSRTGVAIDWGVVSEHYINIGITIVIAFFIWLLGLWSAGDGKLFIAFSALIPLTVYQYGQINNFPAITILINTITPMFLYYMFQVIRNLKSLKLKDFASENLMPKKLMELSIYLFALGWLTELGLKALGYSIDIFITVFMIYFLYLVAHKLFGKNLFNTVAAIAIIRLILDFRVMMHLSFWGEFIGLLLLFIVVRYILQMASHQIFTKKIFVENLKAGMLPAENIYKKGKKYATEPILFVSAIEQAQKEDGIFNKPMDGMTDKEIKSLNTLHKKGDFKNHSIKIYQTLAFAPFLFGGVVLTLLVRGNILFYIRYLIELFF